MVRLSAIVHSKRLLHPNQSGSLPGLSSFDASPSLTQEVRILQRPSLRGSTLLLYLKPGFENVNASTLRASLLSKHTPSYIVDWVSSFLSEMSCTLVFPDSPNLPAPVLVGIPHGSRSPLFFSPSKSPPRTLRYLGANAPLC